MNRRKKEQLRKDKRTARQVASRNKSVHPLLGQLYDDKVAMRCPECGAGPRVPISCKQARATKEGEQTHAEWDLETDKQLHRHLLCNECGEIGYLVEE